MSKLAGTGDTCTLEGDRRMWLKLVGLVTRGIGFAGGKNLIIVGVTALFLVLTAGWTRINYLNGKVAGLEDDIAVLTDTVDVYYNANQINYANVKDLAKKLEMCQIDNMVIAAEGRDAVAGYNKVLEGMKRTVTNEMHRVRQLLENETCASVSIPSGARKLLSNAATSANGASRSN